MYKHVSKYKAETKQTKSTKTQNKQATTTTTTTKTQQQQKQTKRKGQKNQIKKKKKKGIALSVTDTKPQVVKTMRMIRYDQCNQPPRKVRPSPNKNISRNSVSVSAVSRHCGCTLEIAYRVSCPLSYLFPKYITTLMLDADVMGGGG